MLEKLKEIIEEAERVCKETNLKVEDSVLFDCCVRIFNTKNMQIKKDTKEIEEKTPIDKQEPATEKQRELLKKLNKFKEGMTKSEAWQIINENKNKQEKEEEDFEEYY